MSGISPAYCSLDEAYGNWNFKNNQQKQQQNNQQNNNQQYNRYNMDNQQNKDKDKDKEFCPNCVNCLNANNVLQQRILEQTIWPRPRWIPQNPNAYEEYDPYNRYWSSNTQQSGREDFGSGHDYNYNVMYIKPNTLLDIVSLVILTLLILQFIEIIITLCKVN